MANTKDLTGKRFGMLTVLESLDEREDGYRVWRCRCDCGNTVKVNTKQLNRGTMTSCGCVPKSGARRGAKPEDLTGRKFGKLTALERVENYRGRTAWRCQCECGRQKVVTAHDLKGGRVKSCGVGVCRGRSDKKDLTGQRFGRLTAEYPTDRRNKKGSVYWHCRCDCGNTVEVTADNLLWGDYRSCGCLKEENRKKITKRLHHVSGTCIEFLERRKHRSDNSSGCQGVYRMPNGRYRVYIGFRGEKFMLGTYNTFEEAVDCRKDAEDQIYGGFLEAYYEWKEKADKDPAWGEAHPLVFTVEKTEGNNLVISRQ